MGADGWAGTGGEQDYTFLWLTLKDASIVLLFVASNPDEKKFSIFVNIPRNTELQLTLFLAMTAAMILLLRLKTVEKRGYTNNLMRVAVIIDVIASKSRRCY